MLAADIDSDTPVFLPVPTNVSVSSGDTALLSCRIDNIGNDVVYAML